MGFRDLRGRREHQAGRRSVVTGFPVTPGRGAAHNRHGRGPRSSVSGRHLPMVVSRRGAFEAVVTATVNWMRKRYPSELGPIAFEIEQSPRMHDEVPSAIALYSIDEGRVTLYRASIERFAHYHCPDPVHRVERIERVVFEACAEIMGREVWEIVPRDDR